MTTPKQREALAAVSAKIKAMAPETFRAELDRQPVSDLAIALNTLSEFAETLDPAIFDVAQYIPVGPLRTVLRGCSLLSKAGLGAHPNRPFLLSVPTVAESEARNRLSAHVHRMFDPAEDGLSEANVAEYWARVAALTETRA